VLRCPLVNVGTMWKCDKIFLREYEIVFEVSNFVCLILLFEWNIN
jgi:hypothetical protein